MFVPVLSFFGSRSSFFRNLDALRSALQSQHIVISAPNAVIIQVDVARLKEKIHQTSRPVVKKVLSRNVIVGGSTRLMIFSRTDAFCMICSESSSTSLCYLMKH